MCLAASAHSAVGVVESTSCSRMREAESDGTARKEAVKEQKEKPGKPCWKWRGTMTMWKMLIKEQLLWFGDLTISVLNVLCEPCQCTLASS